MVFGWGKKKKEKKIEKNIEPAYVQKQISIEDIPKTVENILQIRTTQLLSEVKSLKNQTEPLLKELTKIGQNLEKDDLDTEDIDRHIRIIVVRGKKQVINAIKKDVIDLPEPTTLEDSEKLNTVLNQILKKIGDVLGRQTRVIHIFAKKYAEKLKEILAQMNSNQSEIQELLDNYNETKKTSQEIIDLINSINEYEKEIQHNKKRILEIKNKIDSLETRRKSLIDSAEKIKSSFEYKEHLKLRSSLEKLNSAKSQLTSQINAQFTKISRPLGRYEYVSSDKEQKIFLSKLLRDPTEVLVSNNKDIVVLILENIKKGIASGSISVKDVTKSLTQITETIDVLDSFIGKVDELTEKNNALENQLKSFNKHKLLNMEKDLEKTLENKEDMSKKIQTFEIETQELRNKIPIELKNLEFKLREFSRTQYSIVKSS